MAKQMCCVFVLAIVVLITSTSVQAGVVLGNTFTYQGELSDGGGLVTDTLPMTFRLFDLPGGGTQFGGDIVLGAVQVVDGRFTVHLDFGEQFTTTAARFLEIEVDGVLLSPRQQITAAPVSLFSLNTRGINVDSQLDVGIGTTSTIYEFQVFTDDRARAIYGNNFDNSAGAKYGVYGRATAPDGFGVYGVHDASTGTNAGVYGETDSTSANAVGVHGVVNTTSAGSFSAAVRGENQGTGLTGIGVYGSHDGQGWGVYGESGNGLGRGVFGHSNGTGGVGGYFSNDDGIAIFADGVDNNGTNAALMVTTGANTMLIDGNEIDSTGTGGLFLNNNNDFDVVLAAGGGDVNLPDSATTLDVEGIIEARNFVRGQTVFAGYNNAAIGYTSRLESDSGNQVTHFRMEATGIVGTITSFNGVVSYNAFTGSHYVTLREPIEPGMLVRLTGNNTWLSADHQGEAVYGVERTQQANDPACLGAYVSEHRDVLTVDAMPIHLVAAVGNGVLHVVDDGRGNIEPGDLLIASDVPGCAMKDDTQRFATGYVVARAAERVDWSMVESGDDGIKRTTMSVLYDPTVRSTPMSDPVLLKQLSDQQALIESLQRRLDALESE